MDLEPGSTPPPLADEGPSQPRRRWLKRLVIAAVVIGLGYAALYIPIPIFYAQLPGPVRNVEPLISIEGTETYSSEGKLLMTTVSVDTSVTFVDWVAAVIDPHSTILMKEDLVPQGTSLEELERQQRAQMDGSKQHAIEVAFAAAGLGRPQGDGVRIVDTVADSPADGELLKNDVIVAVGSTPTETTCDVGGEIDKLEPGDEVTLTVMRDGRRTMVTVATTRNPEDRTSPFVGILMEDVNYEFDTDVEVDIKTGQIAGPSAGLMFTLGIYDLLTPDDLTSGLTIAGTGEIYCDGGVRPIGGIQQKVAGAEAQGADVFLAPQANYADALEAAGDIEVVPVSNFQEALEYLEGLE